MLIKEIASNTELNVTFLSTKTEIIIYCKIHYNNLFYLQIWKTSVLFANNIVSTIHYG